MDYRLGKREDYEEIKSDWDTKQRWWGMKDREVSSYYDIGNQDLRDYVKEYDDKHTNGVYIKGCYFFFTYEGKKYYIISNHKDEWTWDDAQAEFRKTLYERFGLNDFWLDYGEID